MRTEDDLRFLYSPEHSLSREEYQVHKDFSGDSKNNSFVSITIQTSSEDKNLLKKDLAQKLIQLNKYVLEKMEIQVDGKIINFGKEVCSRMKQCELSNTIATIFLDTFWSEKLRKDPRIKIEYPTMKFFDNKFFLPTHFYGVQPGGPLGIESIDMVHFVYQIPAYNEHTSEEMSKIFEQSLTALLENQTTFDTSMFSLSILKDEMQKNSTYTMPFISLTILLLLCFTVASCMTDNWVTSKPIEAMIGILVSSMAIVSAGGLLFALGVPFINQVTVMPFIALAIGVDDVYVMLGAWQDTRRTLDAKKRMGLALEEAGSAITVTSLTSVLSFGIGTYSTTPAIAIFCKFIALAIMFDWFYQLTFFAAVMAMGAKREAAGYHCVFVWKRCDREEIAKAKNENAISPTRYFFENIFAPFICRPSVRFCMLNLYVVYIAIAFYGCSQLTPNLTPSQLVVDDSPLVPYLNLAEKKIWAEGLIGRIYVNNAPDFSKNPEMVDRMLQMVNELESTPYSMGPNSTNFWLNEFNNYRQFFFQEDAKFYETLKSFLKVSFNSHWETDLVWDTPDKSSKGGTKVEKFVFTTAFKISNWNIRTSLLLTWRNITSSYPEFDALVFDENNFYSDQMLELQSTILSSLGTAIILLSAICIMFIAESYIVFWVVCTLISMDIGTAGLLSLWGADLDPMTVVNILMSIGQCIDFATHVGIRIYRSEYSDPDERIRDAMGAIGWPVVQAGTSTLLAIVVMLMVPSSAVRMFARTSVLVVGTGFFHGLIILPIIVRSFATNAKALAPSNH